MARNIHQLKQERKEREMREFSNGHADYLKRTNSYRKYGGVPDSTGKVHELDPKGKALSRKINSPIAKEKRSLRKLHHEGHPNGFTIRRLAELDHKSK